VNELEELARSAAGCTACHLHEIGTRTVFGEGRPDAEVVIVGEQPGDREDVEGRPFVGPAGQLLDRALDRAGIDRALVYVTNAVKHFTWVPRGKRRIHQKPDWREILACKPWLDAELRALRPKVVVALGATAAQALLGKDFRVTRQRGQFFDREPEGLITATVHPSSILRADDREAQFELFVADLAKVPPMLTSLGSGRTPARAAR
jgi:uracil-DNA glycosylase family protein